jgi:hypothetical protein
LEVRLKDQEVVYYARPARKWENGFWDESRIFSGEPRLPSGEFAPIPDRGFPSCPPPVGVHATRAGEESSGGVEPVEAVPREPAAAGPPTAEG